MGDNESGTHAVARRYSVLEVEQACDEADVALAEATACLDFLAQRDLRDDEDSERAVVDAQIAIARVAAAVATLRTSWLETRSAPPTIRAGRVA